jgi:DNA polymerase-3 subunit delta
MKLPFQQLETHLAKTLAPLYLVSGDESLLVQEATDAIRAAALKKGFAERVRISTESASEWGNELFANTQSLSLFSMQRILELDLTNVKLNAANSKLLQEVAQQLSTDTLLLIRVHKLDSKAEQSAWYQALEKKGVAIPIWPIALEQLPQWILQRAKKLQLTMTPAAAQRLAQQVEGNLLAAAQEIEKLSLLQLSGTIDVPMIEEAVVDHAHFDIFTLVDSALSGNRKRSLRILENLAAEDIEPTLVLWALTRELRTLAEIAKQTKQGAALSSLFGKYRIWEKRQPSVRAFLQRHSQQTCWDCLSDAAQIDRMIKGAEVGNVWDALQGLVLKI